MAQIWQAEVQPLGIKMKLQPLTSATYNKREPEGQHHARCLLRPVDHGLRRRPADVLELLLLQGAAAGQQQRDVLQEPDRGYAAGAGQSASRRRRRPDALYAKALPSSISDAPEIWAAQPNDRVALRTNVHGFMYNFLYSSFYYDLYALSKS